MNIIKKSFNYFQYLIGFITLIYFLILGNAPRLPYDIECLEVLESKYNFVLLLSLVVLVLILFLKLYLDYKKLIKTLLLIGLFLFILPIAHKQICSYIAIEFPCV